MRTFQLLFLACLAFGMSMAAAGCGGSEDACTQTGGCEPPPPDSCGNSVCEAPKGENAQTCSADCRSSSKPPTCNNAVCDILEDDMNCPEDCGQAACIARDKEYCAEEGKCWPRGTDCGLPVHTCSGVQRRCETDRQNWSCCGEEFAKCPEARPYYCPSSKTCLSASEKGQCPEGGNACRVWGAACETPG